MRKKILITLIFAICGLILGITVYISFFYMSGSLLVYDGKVSDIVDRTIYKINGDVYCPIILSNKESGKVEECPYYYGKLSADLSGFFFDEAPIADVLLMDYEVTDNFLKENDEPMQFKIYSVSCNGETLDAENILFVQENDEKFILCGKIEQYYSKHTNGDWAKYATELDDLRLVTSPRRRKGDNIFVITSSPLKNSVYYTPCALEAGEYVLTREIVLNWKLFLYDLRGVAM